MLGVAVVFYVGIEQILLGCGFNWEAVGQCMRLLWWSVPGLVLVPFNVMASNYVMCQGLIRPFYWLHGGLYVFIPAFGYFIIVYEGLGIVGFGI